MAENILNWYVLTAFILGVLLSTMVRALIDKARAKVGA